MVPRPGIEPGTNGMEGEHPYHCSTSYCWRSGPIFPLLLPNVTKTSNFWLNIHQNEAFALENVTKISLEASKVVCFATSMPHCICICKLIACDISFTECDIHFFMKCDITFCQNDIKLKLTKLQCNNEIINLRVS